VRAAGLFGGPLADAVHAFKYGGRPALARPLGAWLARRAPLPEGALVVSVPLARARRVARGYDQAALLADALARAAGRRRAAAALRRVRETPPQVGKTREERARNVARAFEARAAVAGRDVVLVDDVVTTGATADAAAAALRRAGARSVVVVALARAE
jgi:ComF family protein